MTADVTFSPGPSRDRPCGRLLVRFCQVSSPHIKGVGDNTGAGLHLHFRMWGLSFRFTSGRRHIVTTEAPERSTVKISCCLISARSSTPALRMFLARFFYQAAVDIEAHSAGASLCRRDDRFCRHRTQIVNHVACFDTGELNHLVHDFLRVGTNGTIFLDSRS